MAEKILVVEDEMLVLRNICEFLQAEGYQVVEARDGAQAMELLSTEHFDLVITDFAMPQVDGLKLVEQIHSRSPNTAVILMTGYLSSKAGKTILQGMAEFIEKPIMLEELLSMVQRLLRSRLLGPVLRCLAALYYFITI